MIKIAKRLLPVAACLLTPLLWHCQTGGSELPNEVHGEIVSNIHVPVGNIRIGLYSVNYIPADSSNRGQAWTTKTDTSGHYSFKEIPTGQYNVVGLQDSVGFFRDSITISGAAEMGADSLTSLGQVSGMVQLQPQDPPQAAVVQVLGTENYVNVDASGAFTLVGLAEGYYRVRVVVALPNYTPLFTNIQVRSGRKDTLLNPLVPFYSGIPVVSGIQTSYDTATGIAKITWHPVTYPAFQSYLVYRDPAGAVQFSNTPINNTRIVDTVYYDTLYSSWNSLLGDTSSQNAPQNWEYRIRVQNKSGQVGETFQSGLLHTVSPSILATQIQITPLGVIPDSLFLRDTLQVFQGDTMHLVVRFANSTTNNLALTWIHGSNDSLKTINLAAKSGTDTLTWVPPSVIGIDSMTVSIRDANGKHWSKTIPFKTGVSRIIGNLNNYWNPIIAMVWNGGIVHVDEDSLGVLSIGLFNVNSGRDSLLSSRAKTFSSSNYINDFSAAIWVDKLYLIGAGISDIPGANVLTYDLPTGAWGSAPNLPVNGFVKCAVADAGKLFTVFEQNDSSGSRSFWALDLNTNTWIQKSYPNIASNGPLQEGSLSEYGGKIYLVGSMDGPYATWLNSYDPTADSWNGLPISSANRYTLGAQMVGMNGNVYLLGGGSMGPDGINVVTSLVEVLSPTLNQWLPAPKYLIARGKPGVAAIGNKIFILGGQISTGAYTSSVEEYHPE